MGQEIGRPVYGVFKDLESELFVRQTNFTRILFSLTNILNTV